MVNLEEEGFEGPQRRPLPVVSPRSLVKHLFNESPAISIPSTKLQEFWSHAESYFEWGANHPGKYTHQPFALYGDGARYTNQAGFTEKVVAILCSFPLWAPKSTRNSRFLLFAIRESLISSIQSTLWPVLRLIVNEFNQMFHEGEPQLCVTEFRGDWEWHLACGNLKPRWNSHRLCFKCRANARQADVDWTDFDSEPPLWLTTMYSHTEFINEVCKPGMICIFA